MHDQIIIGLFQIPREHFYFVKRGSLVDTHSSNNSAVWEEKLTITAHLSIDDISNAHVDDTEKTLVLLFEFLLVKNLNGKNAVFIDTAVIQGFR